MSEQYNEREIWKEEAAIYVLSFVSIYSGNTIFIYI